MPRPGWSPRSLISPPEGPNRPVRLEVQGLTGDRYYELWSMHGDSRIVLATFMTNHDGSCRVTLSIPSLIQPADLALAPRAETQPQTTTGGP